MSETLIYLVVYAVVAMLHFVGLILLFKVENEIPNQTLLTKNLAVAEMLFCLNSVVLFSVLPNVNDLSVKLYLFKILTATDILFYTEIRCSMLHLIFDRFLEIYLNIKYPLYMSPKKVLLLIVVHWGVSVICGIISFVTNFVDNFVDFTLILSMVLDIMILISFIATYIYFYITVRRLRGLEARDAGQPAESGLDLLIKKFKLPCYIVATYICFNFTSTIMFTTAEHLHNVKDKKTLHKFGLIPTIVGLTSDAFIYVFANRNVRKLLNSFCITRNLFSRRSDTTA